MKTIHVSDATYREIIGLAALPFRHTGTRQPDGSWLIPIDDDTGERLERMRLPGESDDDLVARAVRAYRGQQPS
jgi:hypothetical protein